ncbi:MAG: hypothetical protein ACM3RP_02380 [Chitinophagales bacterium]
MRLEVKLADQASAFDVERLVGRRSLRVWPGRSGSLRLQSDYSYRRQVPRWARLAFTMDAVSHATGLTGEQLAGLAASPRERAHSLALRQEADRPPVSAAVAHFAQSEGLSAQEFLSAVSLTLAHQTAGEELSVILPQGILPALFARYPEARLVFLAIEEEPCERLTDLVVLHLYERQKREEVRGALGGSRFFPQVQGGFSPLNLAANACLALSGFFYPWLYFIPVARPGGVFLLFLNDREPFNLGHETPSVFETLGSALGQIHGCVSERLTDLTRFLAAPPPAAVEQLVLGVAASLNNLLVHLYDIEDFDSLDEQLSACFTVARLVEETATGFLTTNAYLRKITFFNVWDKVTGLQRDARPDLREADLKRMLVQPGTFRQRVLPAIPDAPPLNRLLKEQVFAPLVVHLEETLLSGTAPWAAPEGHAGDPDRLLSGLLVNYRNSIHGYGRERIGDYLAHAGLIPDSLIYLVFFWLMALIHRPADFLRGRWVGRTGERS